MACRQNRKKQNSKVYCNYISNWWASFVIAISGEYHHRKVLLFLKVNKVINWHFIARAKTKSWREPKRRKMQDIPVWCALPRSVWLYVNEVSSAVRMLWKSIGTKQVVYCSMVHNSTCTASAFNLRAQVLAVLFASKVEKSDKKWKSGLIDWLKLSSKC